MPVALSAQQGPQAPAEPVVVVSGEGIVLAVPDRAWITISAESRAPSPREAQRRNTEAMRPVQDKLRAAGVPADAVRTIGYDVQYEWDFVNNKRVGRGYVARNTIEVRVDAVDRAAEYLEIAAGSGATSLGGLRFDVKDQARLERDAVRLAVIDAPTEFCRHRYSRPVRSGCLQPVQRRSSSCAGTTRSAAYSGPNR
jgi:uncharacterized protein YggE